MHACARGLIFGDGRTTMAQRNAPSLVNPRSTNVEIDDSNSTRHHALLRRCSRIATPPPSHIDQYKDSSSSRISGHTHHFIRRSKNHRKTTRRNWKGRTRFRCGCQGGGVWSDGILGEICLQSFGWVPSVGRAGLGGNRNNRLYNTILLCKKFDASQWDNFEIWQDSGWGRRKRTSKAIENVPKHITKKKNNENENRRKRLMIIAMELPSDSLCNILHFEIWRQFCGLNEAILSYIFRLIPHYYFVILSGFACIFLNYCVFATTCCFVHVYAKDPKEEGGMEGLAFFYFGWLTSYFLFVLNWIQLSLRFQCFVLFAPPFLIPTFHLCIYI